MASVAATIISLFVLAFAIKTSRTASQSAKAATKSADSAAKAAEVTSKEFELRTRPWIAIKGAKYQPGKDSLPPYFDDVVAFEFENIGTVPTQGCTVDMKYRTRRRDTDWKESSWATAAPSPLDVLFPNETRGWNWPLDKLYSERSQQYIAEFSGTVRYQYAARKYETHFGGEIDFFDVQTPFVVWGHTNAT